MSDYGLMRAVYQALSHEVDGRLPIFHYVPQGVKPPYAVLDLREMNVGNGLPSPHFKTRGELTIRVWSAYEGSAEISQLVGQVASFFKGKKLALNPGWVWFEVKETRFGDHVASSKNPWREGMVEVGFWIHQ